jgi:hypothetical protein
VTIWNNDLDENPYTIYLAGTGLWGTEKIVEDDAELTLLSPNGGESLEAGKIREIRWSGGLRAKGVKLEYSTDNGSSYRTIIDRAANVGSYPWLVPQDLSDSCLVRISDADGAPTMPAIFVFEFKFKVSAAEGESLAGAHFVFQAGVPDPRTQSFQVAEVAFAPDGVRGSENLLFNYALGEIRDLEGFLGNWHQARIAYDMTDYTGSVWIDDQPIVSGVPLKTDLDVERAPEIALRRGPDVAVKLWIDDLDVRFVDLSRMGEDRAKLVFRPLFRDNFNRYESDLFPGGGWLQGPGRLAGEAGSPGREAEEDGRVRRKAAVVDDRVYASSSRSFKLEGSEEEPGTVMKRFSLPDRVPFAVSAEAFVIVGPGEGGRVERGSLAGSERVSGEDGKLRKRESEDADRERNRPALNQRSDRPRREASSVKLGIESTAGSERMMSGPYPSGTFYIYSFDGRLLAEYDVLGNWVKDYIYFGGQLVAEHREWSPLLLCLGPDTLNPDRDRLLRKRRLLGGP